MQNSFLALFCLLIISCGTTQKSVEPSFEIREIIPRYIETKDFVRVSEYMTGKENPGRRVIIRTNPKERAGYYFVLVLNRNVRKLPPDAYVQGEFYTVKSLDKQTQRFDLPAILPSTREIFIGLTGDDWPQKGEAIPSAWQFTIKNSREEILAQEKSYLWSI